MAEYYSNNVAKMTGQKLKSSWCFIKMDERTKKMTESCTGVGVRRRLARSGPCWLDRDMAWTGARGHCRHMGQHGACATPFCMGERRDRSGTHGNRSGKPLARSMTGWLVHHLDLLSLFVILVQWTQSFLWSCQPFCYTELDHFWYSAKINHFSIVLSHFVILSAVLLQWSQPFAIVLNYFAIVLSYFATVPSHFMILSDILW
jgi:hypothetical protein